MRGALVVVAGIAALALGYALVELRRTGDESPRRASAEAARREMLAAMTTTTADVVLLGDSHTQAGEWGELLPGLRAVNRGINGDTTSDLAARLDLALETEARAYVVSIGINDLVRGRGAGETARAIDGLLDRIRARRPDAKLVLTSVLPVDPARLPIPELNSKVRALDDELRGVAERRGAVYLDVAAELSAPDGSLRPELSWDGLHLSAAGYQAWGRALKETLR